MNNEIGAVGHPRTTLLTANDNGIFEATAPIGNGQATICARNVSNGSIYVMWYDSSRHGFIVSNVLSGTGATKGSVVAAHYVSM